MNLSFFLRLFLFRRDLAELPTIVGDTCLLVQPFELVAQVEHHIHGRQDCDVHNQRDSDELHEPDRLPVADQEHHHVVSHKKDDDLVENFEEVLESGFERSTPDQICQLEQTAQHVEQYLEDGVVEEEEGRETEQSSAH